jgi:hypothetical protein
MLASVQRVVEPSGAVLYFCSNHSQPSDTPIAAAPMIRRVCLTAGVFLAGTSWSARRAELEAVERLERAVVAAGGLLTLHTAHSVIGQCSPHSVAWRPWTLVPNP